MPYFNIPGVIPPLPDLPSKPDNRIGAKIIYMSRLIRRSMQTVRALALLIALCAGNAYGQPVSHAAVQVDYAQQSVADTSVLVIRNRSVMIFRASIGVLTPAERAAAASRRIGALLENELAAVVTARPIPEGELVSIGSTGVFTITPSDVDTLRGQTLGSLTEDATSRLRIALAALREETSIPHVTTFASLTLKESCRSSGCFRRRSGPPKTKK